MTRQTLNPPAEETEQEALFRWAALNACRIPELYLLHHIPNGGARSARTGARLKAQGVKPGVPDICLPVARGGKHGLYIELKRRDGGRVSPAQHWWIDSLQAQGFAACVCCGWDDARMAIMCYLRKEDGEHE